MKTSFSRRALIRFASFMIALVAVLGASNIIYMSKLSRLENAVDSGYAAAVENLAQSADRISSVLEKGRYAASPEMMSRLSNSLTECSAEAKAALQSLPVWGLELDNLEKFLSQVGNYASALSERAALGEDLEAADRENLEKLRLCADSLKNSVWQLKGRLLSDDLTVSELFKGIDSESGSFIADGFSEIEDGLSDMPKLIYDGPFSDHILDRVPLMTKDAEEIDLETAREKAALALGEESYRVLECEAGEEGKMPSYCFYCDGGRCAISKNGGYIVYCMKSRAVRDSSLTCEEACGYADGYLARLGIENMERTYYECYNNVCTINYAYSDGGVICYTDLIKVAVALDNGEVLGFDARGFLVNHRERSFGEPAIGEDEAISKAAEGLKVDGCRLAVIPTDAVEEKLCYELKCRADNGRNVLVYLNADTGREEDILILIESDTGVLAE